MEKFVVQFQGLIVFLLLQAICVGVALVRMWQRLSIGEAEMKDAKEDIKECKQSLSELARTMHQIELQAVAVQERFNQIADLSKQIQMDIRESIKTRGHP
jgi:uncharacterized membrane protein (DUF106 family)